MKHIRMSKLIQIMRTEKQAVLTKRDRCGRVERDAISSNTTTNERDKEGIALDLDH